MKPERRVLAASAAIWLLSAMASAAETEPLIGVWKSETRYGPELRGELQIHRNGAAFGARIGDHRGEVKADSREAADGSARSTGAVEVSFGRLGAFRGRLVVARDVGGGEEGNPAIEGFWLQPSAVDQERPNPVGARQAFATPVTLRWSSRGYWSGVVEPLPVRFTLQLGIFRDDDGTLTAAFRNPDFNSNGGASHFRAQREGRAVTFTAGPANAPPQITHRAELDADNERLTTFWPDVGQKLELVRQPPAPARAASAYRKPPTTADGWTTAAARDVGFDEEALARVVGQIAAADPFARRPSLIHSLLVARRGKLVLEEYFHGFDRDTPHDTRSAGKTFSSVMLGAAMRDGARIAPETQVYELLAAGGPYANPDPRKARITLAHLLTHTAGLACDDNDDDSPGNENTMQMQKAQPDWWKYTLDLPMAHDPGTRYAYCSANINLAGAALTRGTNTWLPELFDRTVARPLDFARYHWNLMPTGEGYLGGGAWLRPRDLLKIGQAWLDGGVWRGRRIVEAPWIERSTRRVVKITPATTGLTPDQFSEFYGEGEDALAWHSADVQTGERSLYGYAATGNGGQLLIVIPEIEMAVVFTGGNYRQGGIWSRWRDDIVGAQIIPALRR